MKILIVEDQVLIANHIKNILEDNGFLDIEMAFKIQQATEKLNSNASQLILLDINVEGQNSGIEWAEKNVTDSKIIFITGQNELETLQKAMTVNPIAYLTKPVKEIDLIAAIEVAKKQIKNDSIIIKDGFNDVKLKFDDILFIKSERNYIDIQTTTKKITIRNTLDSFLKELDPKTFCKTHRSYIVNTTKITQKSSNSIFIDTLELPLSRSCNLVL